MARQEGKIHTQDTPPQNAAELYARIEKAIIYLSAHSHAQPSLAGVAAEAGLSGSHFQRLFTQMAGISPKRFLQYTTLEQAKTLLHREDSVMDVAFAVGLSGAGRLHDLFLNGEGMTPGHYKSTGKQLRILYGVCATPFGYGFIARTQYGICALQLYTTRAEAASAITTLHKKWPEAAFVEAVRAEDKAAIQQVAAILDTQGQRAAAKLPLHLRGTNLQLQVWQALLHIPQGSVTTYRALADAVSAPKAFRAVGSAVGDNPVAWLIPCHRVLRSDGKIGGYAYGLERKQALLAYEALMAKK